MSYFSKFRPYYYTPERLTSEQIAMRRAARLVGLAEREHDRLDALQDVRRARMFPDEARLIEQRNALLRGLAHKAREEVEPLRKTGRSNRLLFAAIAGHLQRERLASQPLSRVNFARAKALAAASGKFYDPARASREVLKGSEFNTHRVNRFISQLFRRVMPHVPHGLVPCVDRYTRRQVLFARGHGGKGHRVRHKLKPSSFRECI